MKAQLIRLVVAVCLLVILCDTALQAQVKRLRPIRKGSFKEKLIQNPKGRLSYYLYTPPRLVPGQVYWLVITVHGLGGNGKFAAGYIHFLETQQCIIASPNFGMGPYGMCMEPVPTQVKSMVAEIKQSYSLHDKPFVTGFSAGSQFAHRYALSQEAHVIGCAAYAGGSWGLVDQLHQTNNKDARDENKAAITNPISMSCGSADPRMKMTQMYANELLQKKRHPLRQLYLRGVPHTLDQRIVDESIDTFFFSSYGLNTVAGKQMKTQVSGLARLIAINNTKAALTKIKAIDTWLNMQHKRYQAKIRKAWQLPDEDWLLRHNERCRERWRLRMYRQIAENILSKPQAKNNPSAVRILFADEPEALKVFEAVAGER